MKRLMALAVILLLAASNARAQLNAYFVNVGQGDSIYLEFPNGTNALIDGGPNSAAIEKFLKSKNVTKIDRVVLTHPHSDHYRGLKKVFAMTEVKSFYDSRAENKDAKGDNTLRELASVEPGCQTYYPRIGEDLDWDPSVAVKVLNTCEHLIIISGNDDVNNCSLVLRVSYGGSAIMLDGDAEIPVEDQIVRTFGSYIQSYALKVGHHGSRGASGDNFLSYVKPKVAVISVGVNNVYGHPHAEAIARLQKAGAQIFYTLSGTQTLSFPAPKRGVTGQPQIFPYDPARPQLPETVREVVYTPVVTAPDSVNSPALEQLRDGAFAR